METELTIFKQDAYLGNENKLSRRELPGAEQLISFYLNSKDSQSTTKVTYGYILKGFIDYVNERGLNMSSLTEGDIVAYKNWLYQSGHSVFTVNLYTATLKGFYAWLERKGLYRNIAAELITDPYEKDEIYKSILTIEESSKLLDYADTLNLRDRAIIYLASLNGLRTIEIVRARIKDLKLIRNRHVLMVQCKGQKAANKPSVLPDCVYNRIREYLNTRPEYLEGEALFTSNRTGRRKSDDSKVEKTEYSGRPLTTRTIQMVIKNALKNIGLTDGSYSPHSLRHTVANDMLQNGASIFDVQQVLHHSSSEVTRIYTKITDRQERIDNAPETRMANILDRR